MSAATSKTFVALEWEGSHGELSIDPSKLSNFRPLMSRDHRGSKAPFFFRYSDWSYVVEGEGQDQEQARMRKIPPLVTVEADSAVQDTLIDLLGESWASNVSAVQVHFRPGPGTTRNLFAV